MGENNDINAKNSKKNWGWGIYQKIKASGLLPWKNAFFKGGSFVKLAAEGVLMYFAIRNCQYISAKNN